MRAGRLDVVVATGALWTRDVQCLHPAEPIEVQAVIAGQRVYLDGWPLLVYEATTTAGRTRLVFNQGLYTDPSVTVPATARVVPAEPVEILDAQAAFTVDPVDEAGPDTVPVDALIASDGLTVTLTIPSAVSAAYGPYEGPHSWDCYVQTDAWDWQRLVEGTLTVIRGDTR